MFTVQREQDEMVKIGIPILRMSLNNFIFLPYFVLDLRLMIFPDIIDLSLNQCLITNHDFPMHMHLLFLVIQVPHEFIETIAERKGEP